jgi:hypothetical protein
VTERAESADKKLSRIPFILMTSPPPSRSGTPPPSAPARQALPQLLALMALAVATRIARHNPGALNHNQNEFLSSFLCDDKLEVSEASHTDFLRLSGDTEPSGPR